MVGYRIGKGKDATDAVAVNLFVTQFQVILEFILDNNLHAVLALACHRSFDNLFELLESSDLFLKLDLFILHLVNLEGQVAVHRLLVFNLQLQSLVLLLQLLEFFVARANDGVT